MLPKEMLVLEKMDSLFFVCFFFLEHILLRLTLTLTCNFVLKIKNHLCEGHELLSSSL
jgi:hypothetical protein